MNLGIDIGGSSIKLGMVSNEGQVIKAIKINLTTDRSPDGVMSLLYDGMDQVVVSANFTWKNVLFIGVGCPGQIENGVVVKASNFKSWKHVNVERNIQRQVYKRSGMDIPVHLCNDADAAVAAEYWIGQAKTTLDFVLLTLGTGVGAGVVMNGKIQQGAHGMMEGGHMIVERNGRVCGCTQRGCLEAYASAKAVEQQAMLRMNNDGEPIEAKRVFEMAKDGNKAAKEIVDEACQYLAIGCVNICRLVDPEMIVFAGGMAEAGDALLHRVQTAFEKFAWTKFPNKVKFEIATAGYHTGIIGAVAYPKLCKKPMVAKTTSSIRILHALRILSIVPFVVYLGRKAFRSAK